MKFRWPGESKNRNHSQPPLAGGGETLSREEPTLGQLLPNSSLTRGTGRIRGTSLYLRYKNFDLRKLNFGRSYRLPLAILAALALIGIAAWWIYERSQSAPPPRVQPAARQPAAPSTPPAPQASAAPAEPLPVADIFAVRNWEPPPPPPPTSTSTGSPNAPASAPEPPPLPFRYLGRIVESGKADAFLLAQGNRVIAVSVGNVIDGTYRVEKYENGQLYFLYQPMKAHQALAVGTMGNPS